MLAIDLYCGLGGWTEGFLAEGWSVIGFDNERHAYGTHRYAGKLVLQDVLTLHGSQFKNADAIVASPPCQAYSYRAMPWKRAKALPPPDNTLFDACFRIQREACEAAGRHIPMVVENVCGAQKWVGRARWHYGSFYLWGDVSALMPITFRSVMKAGVTHRSDGTTNFHGVKVGGLDWNDRTRKGQAFNRHAERIHKNTGGSWFNIAHNTTSGKGQNPDGRKVGKDWFGGYGGGFGWDSSPMRRNSSKSSARKAASALIAKIPLELARHIARSLKPLLAEPAR